MAGRFGIDFGTSNTVIAVWDETRCEGVPVSIPDFSYSLPSQLDGLPARERATPCPPLPKGEDWGEGKTSVVQPGESPVFTPASSLLPPPNSPPVSVVPSLIHYASDGVRWIGQQVRQKNLGASERTFSLMKRYVANRSPVKRRLDGLERSHFEAGKDFLSAVLMFLTEEFHVGDEEVVLTVPVEVFEHYVDWLSGVAESAGLRRYRMIDEPSAAALGYGARIQPGHACLIFDFGGGTLDVAVVLIEEQDQAKSGRRCRVLGKAGRDLGGSSIDSWIMREVLRRHGRSDADEEVRQMSACLLSECRAAKELLSTSERAEIRVTHPQTGAVMSSELSQGQFEELLDQHDTFSQIDQTIRRALNEARERGYAEEQIQSVLMVGGSSLIPSVRKTVQRIFGRERVHLERPMEAVACGAAAFAAGVDFYDYIQHDYAIRWTNRQKDDYDYRIIIKRGSSYPTTQPLASLTVKASHAGQTELGIAIFEVGEHRESGGGLPLELVFDPSGAARVVKVTPEDAERRTHFWINEHTPTFLRANPPAQPGEARFVVEFGIDGNKRLLITARDLRTGQFALQDYPVVKLI